MLAGMSDPVIHFVEIDAPTKTACGIPVKDGQIFMRGRPLSGTTIPSAVTCDPCSFRADEVKQELAARTAAENAAKAQAEHAQAVEDARNLLLQEQADGPRD